MEKMKLFLFGLCLMGSNLVIAQNTLPVSEDLNPTSIIVRSSPNTDYITLELSQNRESIAFEIYGMDGKEVYVGKISGTQIIETSTWPSGTYFVICGLQREKFIVSK